MRRLSLYAFVISLAWLCFIVAVVFIEGQAAFQMIVPPENTRAVIPGYLETVAIGYISFFKLNRIEWVCCAFSWFLALRLKVVRPRWCLAVLVVLTVLLLAESRELYSVFEPRLREMKLKQFHADWWNIHPLGYPSVVVMACTAFAKIVCLGVLFAMQVQSFARAVISE